jgi:hypothetical protein
MVGSLNKLNGHVINNWTTQQHPIEINDWKETKK